MATVRELVTRLGFSVDESGMKKYEKGTENIKQKAEAAAVSFRNIFTGFAAFSAIRSLQQTADAMQSLQARVGQLPQTVGNVGESFDTVAANAIAARQGIEEYTTLYTRIGNAAKDYLKTQDEVLQVTNTISKALVVGGASAAESASVMLQLSQALGSGVLQGQEFNAMAEGAPQLLDALSEALGHPRAELKKLASEGKLTTKDLILALQTVSTQFDDQFNKMPLTIGQALTIIGNKWALFINRLNRDSNVVPKIADLMVRSFDAVSNGLVWLTDKLGGAENALKLLGFAVGALLAIWIPGWIAAAAATLAATWPIIALVGLLVGLALIVEDVYHWFKGNDSVLGDLIGHSSAWEKEIENLVSVFNFFKNVLSAVWGTAKFLFMGLLPAIKLFGAAVELAFAPIRWAMEQGGKIGAWLSSKGTPVTAPNAVGASTVAGAAASAGGVGGTNNTQTNNVTINNQLAAGSPPEVAAAAERGTRQGLQSYVPWQRQAEQAI